MNSVVINIMGTDYPVKGDFDPDHIHKLAEKLNNRMSELSKYQKVKSTERTAIFTALNIEDELFSFKSSQDKLKDEISDRIQRLIERIDVSLGLESSD